MRTFVLAALAGMSVFGLWVAAVAGVLLGALLLSVAFRVVVGHLPSYLRAVGTVILTLVATSLALLVLGLVLPGGVGRLFGAAVMFLVGVAVINRVLYMKPGWPLATPGPPWCSWLTWWSPFCWRWRWRSAWCWRRRSAACRPAGLDGRG